jgi:hypothetical protein
MNISRGESVGRKFHIEFDEIQVFANTNSKSSISSSLDNSIVLE